MISHYNVIANVLQNAVFYDFDARKGQVEGAVSLGLLPFYHIYGLVVILHTEIFTGNTVVLVPAFDLDNFLDTIVKYKIEKLFLVPPLVVRLTKDPAVAKKGKPLATVREVFCGAAPLGPQLMTDMKKILADGANFRQGYGVWCHS